MSRYYFAFWGGVGMGLIIAGNTGQPILTAVGLVIALPCAVGVNRRKRQA